MMDAAVRTIHNQRPRHWPGRVMALVLCGFWLVTCGLLGTSLLANNTVLCLVLTLVALLGSCLAAITTLMLLPVARLRLGDNLEDEHERKYTPSEIRLIEFGPDPVEDYVESSLPVPCCQVTIRLASGRGFRLIVTVPDAVRLRDWAVGRGIIVHDPHGCSTRGARNEPG
jgi:hypothetical protein